MMSQLHLVVVIGFKFASLQKQDLLVKNSGAQRMRVINGLLAASLYLLYSKKKKDEIENYINGSFNIFFPAPRIYSLDYICSTLETSDLKSSDIGSQRYIQ